MNDGGTFAAKANWLPFTTLHDLVNTMAMELNAQHKNLGREYITLSNSFGQRKRIHELLIPKDLRRRKGDAFHNYPDEINRKTYQA